MEIGSEFWISDLPTKKLDSDIDWINTWGNYTLTSSGRGAISLMLKQIENKVISKTVLLPSYICESIIIPFIKEGYDCYFYDVNKEFMICKEGIEKFIESKIGICLHIGYYGFSTNYESYDLIDKFRKKGTIIIEDITHTLFSKYERYVYNDYYIASLRKWIGIPSGGFLAHKGTKFYNNLKVQEDFANKRKEALTIKGKYMITSQRSLKQIYLDIFQESEIILDENPKVYTIDEISNSIINSLNENEIIEARKVNFDFLLKNIRDIKVISPVFNYRVKDICPMFFPVYVEIDREIMRNILANEDIFCPIHWPIPRQIDISNYPESSKIYKNILSIPCDQRYSIKDMSRIIDVIKTVEINDN